MWNISLPLGNVTDYISYFIYGQVTLLIAIAISILLEPSSLLANDGVSYFGVHLPSALVYSIGLVLAGWFCFKTAKAMPKYKMLLPVKIGLYSLLPVSVGIVATPYNIGYNFISFHRLFGITFFAVELLIAIWLVLMVYASTVSMLLVGLMVIEALASAFYLAPVAGYLLQTESAFQLTFAVFMVIQLKSISSLNNSQSKL